MITSSEVKRGCKLLPSRKHDGPRKCVCGVVGCYVAYLLMATHLTVRCCWVCLNFHEKKTLLHVVCPAVSITLASFCVIFVHSAVVHWFLHISHGNFCW